MHWWMRQNVSNMNSRAFSMKSSRQATRKKSLMSTYNGHTLLHTCYFIHYTIYFIQYTIYIQQLHLSTQWLAFNTLTATGAVSRQDLSFTQMPAAHMLLNQRTAQWVIEQGLTSPPTQYSRPQAAKNSPYPPKLYLPPKIRRKKFGLAGYQLNFDEELAIGKIPAKIRLIVKNSWKTFLHYLHFACRMYAFDSRACRQQQAI